LVNRVKGGGGIVQPKTTFLSRFCVKFLEVAGAGLASAICAYVLGQAGATHPAPTPVVQVASVSPVAAAQVSSAQVAPASPVAEEAARMAREDHALLMELARKKDADTPQKPEAALAPAAAPVPKALKPAPVAQPRRAQKAEQTAVIEIKPPPAEPLPILPSVTVGSSAARTAAPAPQSADAALGRDPSAASTPNSGETDRPLFARLKLVPSWFSPANERPNDRPVADVPRPPMPVGEALRNLM
jgi:hypothetical protein